MKKLFAALALASVACATPALAQVGVSVSIGEPGFYGQLDIGNTDRPRIINSRPVVIVHRYRNLAPIYLRVPASQQRNWNRYCDRYNACTRPVYFVRDDWYQKVYAPHYRTSHEHYGRDDHRDGRDNHDVHDNHDGHDNNDHRDDRNDHRNDRH